MGMSNVKFSKTPDAVSRSARTADEKWPVSEGAHTVLLALQRNGGNQAVGRLLDAVSGKPPGAPGRPLDERTRTEMEARFGEDFRDVRIHPDGAAALTARDVGAQAYTAGSHISFAPGRYDPASTGGRSLMAHELAHVVQQRRGGTAPALDAGTAHEQGAEAAASAFVSGSGPISVSGSTGAGIARSAEDWLQGSVDLTNWRYSDLISEREELRQWMDRQLASDDRTLRIEEAINLINTQIAALETGVRGPQKAPKKRGGKRSKSTTAEAAEAPATPGPEMNPPRCLVEKSTIAFQDPEEMRQEFDHIVAWLQHKDVPADDRRILQAELDYLAPLLGQTLHQRAQEQRRATIGRALTPSGTSDARASIREAVRLVDSIKPVAGRDDQYYLMHGEEMITLTKDEASGIRAATIAQLEKAARQVLQVDENSQSKLTAQASVDREHPFAAWGTSLFTDKTTWDVIDEFGPISIGVINAWSRFNAAKRTDDLMAMAEELANAEELAVKGRLLVNAHVDDIQTTGGKIITGLEITKTAAFTIVMIGTAGAAAPVIGAGVAGAGATGATATALTAAGTAGVVGAEGFVLGGGSATAGELAAGKSLGDAAATGFQEGKKWGETGVKIGVSTVAAPLVAARFGVGAQGVSTASQMLRSGAAAGTTNLGVEAGSRALFHQETLSLSEAGSTFAGGFLGGAGGPLTQKLTNPVVRGAANVALGAGSSGVATYLETGDVDKAWQSAAVGGATALGMGQPPKPSQKTLDKAFASGQKVRSTVRSATRSSANTLRATMLGLELSGAAPYVPGGSVGIPARPGATMLAPSRLTSGLPSHGEVGKPPAPELAKPSQPEVQVPPKASAPVADNAQAELAQRGYRPAPGERTTTKAQYKTQQSQLRWDKRVSQAVDQGFTEYAGPAADARAVRPPRVPRSADAAQARTVFQGSLRDSYAQALQVAAYGQVHHAIEVQVLSRYPGVYTPGEINQAQNMRGIPPELGRRTQLHNSKIREILDRHYVALDAEIARQGLLPGTPAYNQLVRAWMSNARAEIDWMLGQFFSEQRATMTWERIP
jgi:uncharacterized protein DUF4157